jgi:signal transduction histidine kinase
MAWSRAEVLAADGTVVASTSSAADRRPDGRPLWPLPGGLTLQATPCADEARAALARAFAHEVRSPLNALGVYVDMLGRPDERSDDGPKAADLAARAARQLGRVEELLQVFLELWAPERAPDLTTTLTAAVRLAAHEAMRRGHSLTFQAEGPLPVRSSPAALLDALGHLFEAIWSQPERTTASLRLRGSDDEVLLEVEGVRLPGESLRTPFALAGGKVGHADGRLCVRFLSDGGCR